jgi:hypothetical protein
MIVRRGGNPWISRTRAALPLVVGMCTACGGKLDAHAGSPGETAGNGGAAGVASGGAGGAGGSTAAGGSSAGDGGAGGSAGSGATGGGTAGMANGGGAGVAAPFDMIDDMEDGDAQILWTNERAGGWYSFSGRPGGEPDQYPPTGGPWSMAKLVPPRTAPDGRMSLLGAQCIAPPEPSRIGCALDLRNWNGIRSPYDGSTYTGVAFWAKLGEAASSPAIEVRFPDANTDAMAGTCRDALGTCDNDFGFQVNDVTLDWKQFHVAWSDLRPRADGIAAFRPDAIYSIRFVAVYLSRMDLVIDDLAFYR